ncbi:hypothetical protein RRG08_012942 [Elysia crispata]|uniref:Uncharacterized protein n=1 Tax=Elysia crispata TaxID=231223 RepID=A0AAE1A0G8_9GAST|nr:hypothetical protein RRG08_012942 [Elysia crispata]
MVPRRPVSTASLSGCHKAILELTITWSSSEVTKTGHFVFIAYAKKLISSAVTGFRQGLACCVINSDKSNNNHRFVRSVSPLQISSLCLVDLASPEKLIRLVHALPLLFPLTVAADNCVSTVISPTTPPFILPRRQSCNDPVRFCRLSNFPIFTSDQRHIVNFKFILDSIKQCSPCLDKLPPPSPDRGSCTSRRNCSALKRLHTRPGLGFNENNTLGKKVSRLIHSLQTSGYGIEPWITTDHNGHQTHPVDWLSRDGYLQPGYVQCTRPNSALFKWQVEPSDTGLGPGVGCCATSIMVTMLQQLDDARNNVSNLKVTFSVGTRFGETHRSPVLFAGVNPSST